MPLLLRCRDLVADALARDLALELGERQQHVQRQPAHRGGGVELLRDRDERDAVGIEDLDDLGEVGQRAGQPVDLVDHHNVDLAGRDVGQQTLQGRPLHGAAGEAAVVVRGRQHDPALVLLAPDVGLAGLALGVQRVELLLQPLLGGLAGVDGAPDQRAATAAHGRLRVGHQLRPPHEREIVERSPSLRSCPLAPGQRTVAPTSEHR